MKIKAVIAAIMITFTLAACSQGNQKQTIGTITGAAAGGLLGAQVGSGSGRVAATAAGALIGALIGSEIGRSMDEVDRMKAEQAYTQATSAPIGQEITWNNPDSGNYGTVTPTREGTSSAGNYCREFQQTVVIGGKQEQAYGVACRQPDGSWEIQ